VTTYFAFAPAAAQPELPVGSVARHSVAFIVLTIALNAAYFPRGPVWIPALLLAGYGLAIELIQAFIPYRFAEVKDFLVDLAGIGVGTFLYRWPVTGLVARWFR
jgi:VanZ family protein